MSDTTTALTRRRHAIDALSQLPPGTQIGRYEIRALLGVGGMGAVYDAHDTELGRAVALKLLHPERSEVSGLADRLVHESRLMARIAHPSVIAVYDAGHQGSSVFIAMELVRGSTLAAWLASHELDWRAIVALFERAGQGLVAAHTAGIIHRDFKPENVLVARDADKVVVTDFGLAREAEDWSEDGSGDPRTTLARRPHEARMTTDGAVIGTPAYMAPEQIAARAVDVRADVFAFSVSLWAALFGQRPFPGASVVEIYAAMHLPLAPPPAGAPRVPRRLLRALRRGLAIDARDRWPDMQSLLVELAAIRGARRRRALAAGGVGIIGVIGLGIAALLVGRPPPTVDPCVRALAQLDGAYTPALAAQVRSALAGDPKTQSSVLSRLAATAGALQATHLATCHAGREIAQDPKIIACLDARRLELTGTVDDLIANGPGGARYASRISEVPGSPSACAAPPPGLLFARLPADRELRRKVTALRARIADAGRISDNNQKLDETRSIVADAAALWPPVHAEALQALGDLHRGAGDAKLAIATLLDAASTAERAHHDDTAAKIWTRLTQTALFDLGDPARAVEYATNGEAALDRIARPDHQVMLLEYAKGLALIGVNRYQDAEVALRASLRIAEATGPYAVSISLQAVATLYGVQGKYADAAATYRKAIDLRTTSAPNAAWQPPDFELYGLSLARLGRPEDAEAWARRAIDLADRTLPEGHRQRQSAHISHAQLLLDVGRDTQALAEVTHEIEIFGRKDGKRGQNYAEALLVQGDILTYTDRYAEAEPVLAHACEVLAFTSGDNGIEVAECEVSRGAALGGLHRDAEALAALSRAVPSLVKWYGDSHPLVAGALTIRGAAHAALGHHPAATADFERAIAILADQPIDPGFLASAKWQLGKELWAEQRARGRAEIAAALALFKTANGRWAHQRTQAAAWLEGHDRRRRKR